MENLITQESSIIKKNKNNFIIMEKNIKFLKNESKKIYIKTKNY